jgi:hypothetical protein
MATYDVLVSDELLPEFTNDSHRKPVGFHILKRVGEGTAPWLSRYRVQDDSAPAWTEGKLITPTFTADYEMLNDRPTGNFTVRVTGWTEEPQAAP